MTGLRFALNVGDFPPQHVEQSSRISFAVDKIVPPEQDAVET